MDLYYGRYAGAYGGYGSPRGHHCQKEAEVSLRWVSTALRTYSCERTVKIP